MDYRGTTINNDFTELVDYLKDDWRRKSFRFFQKDRRFCEKRRLYSWSDAIRVLEKQLIQKPLIERMIAADSIEEA